MRRVVSFSSLHSFVVWASFLAVIPAYAQNGAAAPTDANFGGPDAVENQLSTDHALNFGAEIRKRLEQEAGFTFGLDYSALGLAATNSPGANSAGGGIARIYGSWELFGRGTPDNGALVFKGEHRHSYSRVPPSAFGFNTGYVGIYNPPFNDQGFRLTNLYWRQRFANGNTTVTAGFLDVTDYVDAYALASPWTGFGNLVFSTGSATIGLPNDATLGIAAGFMLTKHLYAIVGVADANADPTKPFKGFNQLFDESQFFKSLEIGWTSSKERLVLDNVHATIWHTDGSTIFAVPAGWGIALSAAYFFQDKWHLFARGGFAEDGGTLLQASVGGGVGYVFGEKGHLLAGGINWGRPNASTFGPGLRDQWTGELFLRLSVTENITITPDVQLIINPALNPGAQAIGVFGIRGRVHL